MVQRWKRIYNTILIACIAGFAWLGYSVFFPTPALKLCLIKGVTGFACPSCGTTRAMQSLLSGNIVESLSVNPFGVLVAGIMFFLIFFMSYDAITKSNKLYVVYSWIEDNIKRPRIAIPLIVLVLINWAWTIAKGL